MTDTALIARVLLQPDLVSNLSPSEFDLLIRQGRRANLLAKLASILNSAGLDNLVPIEPRRHLESALLVATRQNAAVRWEVTCIQRALADRDIPLILLKGAAYVLAELPVARGRMFSDVDILVPKGQIPIVENGLMLNGWQTTHHGAYDQRYYREWMHEIPPMRHVQRETVIDVHHAILPETARIKVNTNALFDDIRRIPGRANVFVLSPTDMVLHSATHLFHEGELENGLRDLFDLDSLLRHFGESPEFWENLIPRAQALGLTRPMYYAIELTKRILDTPIPNSVIAESRAGGPQKSLSQIMNALYELALQPMHSSCNRKWTGLARQALYLRSHWLRMPFPLLVYHLSRKALVQKKEASEEEPGVLDKAHLKP